MLVEIKNTTVKYGKLLVIDNLNWSLEKGENWAVLGPNGSGKSTLVNLILGDNLQAYANDIYLFGKRKGSGETVWDIKKKIGFVSSGLQIHYRKQILAHDVILSGFFDSIGLYRHATPEQQLIAQGWIETLGISEKSKKRFNQLSYGEKRLILIARAMVKSPPLLIMDEPCQGLDKENRKMIAWYQERNRLLTQVLFTRKRDMVKLYPCSWFDTNMLPLSCFVRKKPYFTLISARWWFFFKSWKVWMKKQDLKKTPGFDPTRNYPYFSGKFYPDRIKGSGYINKVAKWWWRTVGIPVDREAGK